MATKNELEAENVELKAQIAALGYAPAEPLDCDKRCEHGTKYHQWECHIEISGDMSVPCVCPDHPETAPERRNMAETNG